MELHAAESCVRLMDMMCVPPLKSPRKRCSAFCSLSWKAPVCWICSPDSGQLGIEALSRGAGFCTFVDSARASQDLVRQNLTSTGLGANARVMPMDYLAFLQSTRETFDIALLDPPYAKGMIDQALPLLAEKMSESGVIVCETDKKEELPAQAGSLWDLSGIPVWKEQADGIPSEGFR